MTSSESDYTAKIKQDETPKEKSIPAHNRRRFNIVAPDETAGTPAETLPITGIAENVNTALINSVTNVETNADGDEIDTSNNYTAAENDHDSNATL